MTGGLIERQSCVFAISAKSTLVLLSTAVLLTLDSNLAGRFDTLCCSLERLVEGRAFKHFAVVFLGHFCFQRFSIAHKSAIQAPLERRRWVAFDAEQEVKGEK